MARINLLPWREQLREERRKQFLVILGGIFVLSCGAVFLGDQYLSGEIARQERAMPSSSRTLPSWTCASRRSANSRPVVSNCWRG